VFGTGGSDVLGDVHGETFPGRRFENHFPLCLTLQHPTSLQIGINQQTMYITLRASRYDLMIFMLGKP
jgi:hypothetical protein